MSFVAVAIGGSALLGTAGSIYASNKAAHAQKDAANKANDTSLAIYNQNTANEQPYLDAGSSALNKLSTLYGLNGSAQPQSGSGHVNTAGYETATPVEQGASSSGMPDYESFFSSPDYQYALDQGIKARDQSAAARGTLYAGGYGKDINNFAQGIATQNLNNYMNRLSHIAGMGQAAAGALSGVSTNYANQNATNLMNAGNATATGYINAGNAINNGVNQLGIAAGYHVGQGNPSTYHIAPSNNLSTYQGLNDGRAPDNLNFALAGTGG